MLPPVRKLVPDAGIPRGTIHPALAPDPDLLYFGPHESAPEGARPQKAGVDAETSEKPSLTPGPAA